MSLLPPPLPSLSHYYLQQPNVDLHSLLLRAAALGHTSVIQELMQNNPELDVNSQDEDGRTALTWAAMMGREEVGWVLASRGAKVNARDHAGWTPLHWATIRYQINFVRLLLDFGASPTDTSNSEKTPLQLITTDHSPYALQVKQVLQDRLYQNDKEHSLSLNIEIPLDEVNFATHEPHTLIPFPLHDAKLDSLLDKIILHLPADKTLPGKSIVTNAIFRMARYADDWGGEEWTEKLLHLVVDKMAMRLKNTSKNPLKSWLELAIWQLSSGFYLLFLLRKDSALLLTSAASQCEITDLILTILSTLINVLGIPLAKASVLIKHEESAKQSGATILKKSSSWLRNLLLHEEELDIEQPRDFITFLNDIYTAFIAYDCNQVIVRQVFTRLFVKIDDILTATLLQNCSKAEAVEARMHISSIQEWADSVGLSTSSLIDCIKLSQFLQVFTTSDVDTLVADLGIRPDLVEEAVKTFQYSKDETPKVWKSSVVPAIAAKLDIHNWKIPQAVDELQSPWLDRLGIYVPQTILMGLGLSHSSQTQHS